MDIGDVERMTPERRREQTRAYLLNAAAAVFAARGFHQATLDEVAEAAGFTKGAIYSNFASKEELLLALVDQRSTAMLEQFFTAAAEPDRGRRLQAISEAYLRLVPTPAEWALWEEFSLYALRNPDVADKVEIATREGFPLLVGLVEDHCRAMGVEPPLPAESLARMYLALFDGLARQRAQDPDAVPDELFAQLVTFIDDAVAALGKRA